ncbi:DNA-formamidopyrimidine glycosylase [Oscillatoria sp. CS-180]|uniref:DNA-formamidopyrimidine glycosylase n=1 Tax=Oscillatoria sp. CS-180 TaxID=3021720 RepID=UPI0023304B9D|nr:DNA-formamidopyrimidine glycosylase [Oscillatoria sp. CS-180]MDB9526737.1 DNA-formamidopyrimidine glycosylase [Oscillatoria sp. CS-180]
MPELPEVETVRRGLNQVTQSALIRGGQVLLPRSIAHPGSVEAFLDGVAETTLLAWNRRGKYLLATLQAANGEPAGHLGVHLRMTGQLLWMPFQEPMSKHCRVILHLDKAHDLRFIDQRTFGRLWWVPAQHSIESIITGIAALGPEPLSDRFSPDYLYTVTRRRHRPIKNALLDQALIAGIGNIYADEALFLSGIRPTTLCARLGRKRIVRLHNAIQKTLEAAIAQGGTTFSDFRNVHGVNGNYGGIANVYDREEQPCRVCGTPIRRIKLAGRSAHFCPQCQR